MSVKFKNIEDKELPAKELEFETEYKPEYGKVTGNVDLDKIVEKEQNSGTSTNGVTFTDEDQHHHDLFHLYMIDIGGSDNIGMIEGYRYYVNSYYDETLTTTIEEAQKQLEGEVNHTAE